MWMKVCHILGVEFEDEIDQELGLFLRLILLVLAGPILLCAQTTSTYTHNPTNGNRP